MSDKEISNSELESFKLANPPLKNIDSNSHLSGRSVYIDDVSEHAGSLHAYVFYLETAHARIKSLDTSAAEKMPGVHRIFSYKDIPGENQIGGIIKDEALLAEEEVHFWGQPVLLVVATTQALAKKAAKNIQVEFEELAVTLSPREAALKNSLLFPPSQFARGDTAKAWAQCAHVVTGSGETPAQEHLYLEPQGAYAIPLEAGGVKVISSTQGPTAVQRTVATVLACPMHQVEVEVGRLGGGFGGKEDQANPWAALAALAAIKLNRPVKIVLQRSDDMRMTGKRHPYCFDFKIGLDHSGRILAYEVSFYQNGGAATDLSPGVLSRSLFHACNAYFIPNVKAIGYSCKTNLPPNTAFRGFGGPQGIFAIEAAVRTAAEQCGFAVEELQKKNLLSEGDRFHFGQEAKFCQARATWAHLEKSYDPVEIKDRISEFNRQNMEQKKGFAVVPVCFGIAFTKTSLNQASALVHIYKDGSVGVSTAAVEMGQGVNTKILQVVRNIFHIAANRIKIYSTNTSRVANTSPTAASAGADLNAKATERACSKLLNNLLEAARQILGLKSLKEPLSIKNDQVYLAGKATDIDWCQLIEHAYEARLPLSAQEHYATPDLHFDLKEMQGKPFSYHVYGCSLTEVTVDTLRGRYSIDRVSIVHDSGMPFNRLIDLGQIEGALMQGIGWMTVEEFLFNEKGKPLTDTLSTYKIPGISCAAKEVNVSFLPHSPNSAGIYHSKAVGEPPLMYGIGAFMAIREAIKAFTGKRVNIGFSAPLSPEKVLMSLYGDQLHEIP